MATWVIQDFIEAHVLADAPAGQAGMGRAWLGFFDKAGPVVGAVFVMVIPGRFLILPWFHNLAWCSAVVGLWRHSTPIA